MVQCAKVVSMTPQDGAAANNWRKANKGVSVLGWSSVNFMLTTPVYFKPCDGKNCVPITY